MEEQNYTYPYKLPNGWCVLTVSESCENISLNGIKIKQKQYLKEGEFPVVDQGQEIIGGYFNDKSLIVPGKPPYVVFGDHTKVKKYINFKFIAGADGVKVLSPLDFFLPKLFFHFIHFIKIPDKGYARHFQFLATSEIPIPPFKEQERIFSKLEDLFSDLDKGIESLEKAQQQLKVYRQAVLKWAFEGKLTNRNVVDGELPKGWEVKLLKQICHIIGGVTKGKKLEGKETIELPYLRVANVQDGFLDLRHIKSIAVVPTDKEKYRLKKGDILYTEGGDRDKLGRGTVWREEIKDCIHQNHIFRARPLSSELNSKYIAYYSQSKSARSYFFQKGKQTTNLASINLTVISNLPIPISKVKEQERIIQEIESRLSVCDKIEETISESLLQAEALRLSIIKKAFEGKLVKQNPKDEPATKLLEKIRAEKESAALKGQDTLTKGEALRKNRREKKDATLRTKKNKNLKSPERVK